MNTDSNVTDSLTEGHLEPLIKTGCGICGGILVSIRGKYPGMPKRVVCPTCLQERIDQINNISSSNYGVACQNKP